MAIQSLKDFDPVNSNDLVTNLACEKVIRTVCFKLNDKNLLPNGRKWTFYYNKKKPIMVLCKWLILFPVMTCQNYCMQWDCTISSKQMAAVLWLFKEKLKVWMEIYFVPILLVTVHFKEE